MYLTGTQTVITILAVALGTMLTRFLPFLLFPENKQIPGGVAYLGRTLPAAMIGLLVVYCFRDVALAQTPHGLPELLAVGATALLHVWKGNALLSIGAGTAVYMLLVQLVF